MSQPTVAPLISVLMPIRNGEKYLAEALDSVVAQTLPDFEFIIVDDGSTDSTPALLASYAGYDPRFKILTRDHVGPVEALNIGLAEARGTYIARMDGDDICLPQRFEKQANYLRDHPECVLVGSRVMLIDPEGAELYPMESILLEHRSVADGSGLAPGTPGHHDASQHRQRAGRISRHVSLRRS
jgi:glycosyltransferase involved in cell wall biosynthesis